MRENELRIERRRVAREDRAELAEEERRAARDAEFPDAGAVYIAACWAEIDAAQVQAAEAVLNARAAVGDSTGLERKLRLRAVVRCEHRARRAARLSFDRPR